DLRHCSLLQPRADRQPVASDKAARGGEQHRERNVARLGRRKQDAQRVMLIEMGEPGRAITSDEPDLGDTGYPGSRTLGNRGLGGFLVAGRDGSVAGSRRLARWSRGINSRSVLARWPGWARARSSAGPTPPASAIWLSLISIASSRPKR